MSDLNDKTPEITLVPATKDWYIDHRIYETLEQLWRYGGSPAFSEEFIPILYALTDLNDDMCHGRHKDLIISNVQKITDLLNTIALKYKELHP